MMQVEIVSVGPMLLVNVVTSVMISIMISPTVQVLPIYEQFIDFDHGFHLRVLDLLIQTDDKEVRFVMHINLRSLIDS